MTGSLSQTRGRPEPGPMLHPNEPRLVFLSTSGVVLPVTSEYDRYTLLASASQAFREAFRAQVSRQAFALRSLSPADDGGAR